jgi:hypothetical protein
MFLAQRISDHPQLVVMPAAPLSWRTADLTTPKAELSKALHTIW